MLFQNQINSFANFAFNLMICIVSFYLFIYLFDRPSKIQKDLFFSCIVKKIQIN